MADDDAHSSAGSSDGWDNDVDISTKEGWRKYRRSENKMMQQMNRAMEERNRQHRGPDAAYEILKELYDKAEKDNDALTADERALLLSRSDLVGKALAHPDSLTLEERYEVARWSPPDALHAAIRAATDGAAETPEQLYALARTGGPGDAASRLRPEALRILTRRFELDEAPPGRPPGRPPGLMWFGIPGNGSASILLMQRAGMDIRYLLSLAWAEMGLLEPPSGNLPTMVLGRRPLSTQDNDNDEDEGGSGDGRPRKRLATRDARDDASNPAWPTEVDATLGQPIRLFYHAEMKPEPDFADEFFEDVQDEVLPRWEALSAAQQAAYTTQSEALRTQLWDQADADRARGWPLPASQRLHPPGHDEYLEWQERESYKPARPPIPTGRDALQADGRRQWPAYVSASQFQPFALFQADQRAAHLGRRLQDVWQVTDAFGEAARRYKALSTAERTAYEARTEALRHEAWDRWDAVQRRLAEGEEEQVDVRAAMRLSVEGPPSPPPATARRPRAWPFTRDSVDASGAPKWPLHVNPGAFKPFGLWCADQRRTQQHPGVLLRDDAWGLGPGVDEGEELVRRFDALGAAERAVLEARSEALRQEVWDEWEAYESRRARGEIVARPAHRVRP